MPPKRKSTDGVASTSKKARSNVDYAPAAALVSAVLATPATYAIPEEDEDVRELLWRPSCKTNSAKWTYVGICPDPAVFGVLMGLDGPPTFKQKKFSKAEFQDLIGNCEGHARYNTLYITGDHVNVRWSETGEFKFSGSYGISYS
ncbi:hypothetical protein DAEQUDRAFT_744655 [Daedalea quercina L-15889]|uniref:Uncharacterized protein n=1 Tax=Daedalea quercina L-15889 TaxID=1314783 RepID=A0A165RFH8_9APHY|nr:hypothetical protein DAEQUDRAFT_744655 [Daedalea quercina L-15889]